MFFMAQIKTSNLTSTGDIGGFPNPLDSTELKSQDDWGYRYVTAMWAEHTKNISTFNTRRENAIVNRKRRRYRSL